MYNHSRQTFLSLTAQRARHSSTSQVLYGEDVSGSSSGANAPKPQVISFPEVDDEAVERLWADLRCSLGER